MKHYYRPSAQIIKDYLTPLVSERTHELLCRPTGLTSARNAGPADVWRERRSSRTRRGPQWCVWGSSCSSQWLPLWRSCLCHSRRGSSHPGRGSSLSCCHCHEPGQPRSGCHRYVCRARVPASTDGVSLARHSAASIAASSRGLLLRPPSREDWPPLLLPLGRQAPSRAPAWLPRGAQGRP